MAEAEETVKIEIEVPKEQVKIEGKPITDAKTPPDKKGKERPGIASYDPLEIAKAPLEAPEPINKERPNRHQQRVMLFGFILVMVAPILIVLFNFTAGIVMAITGAAVIAFGALVKV